MDKSKVELKARLERIWEKPNLFSFFKKYARPPRLIKKGTVLFNPGDPLQGVYFIEEGFIKLYEVSEGGRETIIYLTGPGNMLSLRAMVSKEQTAHQYTEAITDVKLYTMRTERVDSVWVGTDRMVQDGFANKVGTYTLAVLAHVHGIPFYVVGPYTTMDRYHKLADLHELIENREGLEVRNNVVPKIPDNVPVGDLAFDLTEIDYVDHFILDSGAYTPEEYQTVFNQLAPT